MPERSDPVESLLDALRARPLPEPSRAVDARVRAAGGRAYERAHRDAARSLLPSAALAVALVALTSVYLGCALNAASALYR